GPLSEPDKHSQPRATAALHGSGPSDHHGRPWRRPLGPGLGAFTEHTLRRVIRAPWRAVLENALLLVETLGTGVQLHRALPVQSGVELDLITHGVPQLIGVLVHHTGQLVGGVLVQ